MANKKRDYEVSIWSLRDEFITVLKPAHLENKEQMTEPEMNLKTDGTQDCSFSIPMYIYKEGERVENPIWYNTLNGNLIINMRKIKVIFNKDTDDEKIFDFIITRVTERHEKDELYCDVECEGLAFHELGKKGYKISLSSEAFYNENYEWFKKDEEDRGEEPRATLQYWLNKFLEPASEGKKDPNTWFYRIEMDWSSYKDGEHRASDKVYEESYTSSWVINESTDRIEPKSIENFKEKERLVDLEESNTYNLTQDLAKAFGVFCRYEYGYDENYHIDSRTVVFYNNFMREKDGYLNLSYPYSTDSISREIDSSDLTTKMYVRPVDNENSASGWSTIMNVEANKSLEDYVLNFDYLYKVGAIDAEVYSKIPEYEKNLRKYNQELIVLEQEIISLQNRLPEVEAKLTTATNAVQLDGERLGAAGKLLDNLDKEDGTAGNGIAITASNPRTAVLMQDLSKNDGSRYIKIADSGVDISSVHIYKTLHYANTVEQDRLADELVTGIPEYDEFGNLTRINNLFLTGKDQSSIVYLIYNYFPKLYYQRVEDTWTRRLAKDQADKKAADKELKDINDTLTEKQEQQKQKLKEQAKCRADFEKMMGPALREGYWQPEDYKDYGDSYIDTFSLPMEVDDTKVLAGNSNLTEFLWDNNLFDSEQKSFYKIGTEERIAKYPCIELPWDEKALRRNLDKLAVLFFTPLKELKESSEEPTSNDQNNTPARTDYRNMRVFSLGSQCQLGFTIVEESNSNKETVKNIVPILILTGAELLNEEEITQMKNTAVIGYLTTEKDPETNEQQVKLNELLPHGSIEWIESQNKTSATEEPSNIIYYPRLKINSLFLKTSSDQLNIHYNNRTLAEFEDYYIFTRDNSYYLTIKPEAIYGLSSDNNEQPTNDDSSEESVEDKKIILKFSISNADISIYLDALQVLKENAFPKVSYKITPSIMNEDFIYTAYNNLARIVNINDNDLKFENVQCYISELHLDLDEPWNDDIIVKNYKTKFEDLFSTIVAQTEAMKKNEYTIGLAAGLFMPNGQLSGDILQGALRKVDLNYSFNNGQLVMDAKEGIWGLSDSGVVAFRGGGIFTANNKDANGNWIWNTGIVPQGINASMITTGQLDTSMVKIYAGDQTKFQLNEKGLFAYKSFLQDFDYYSELSSSAKTDLSNAKKVDGFLDPAQYVVFNSEGLFLKAKNGALVLNKDHTDYYKIAQDIDRVAITWDGLTLRDYTNKKTFFADANTGDLYLAGTVFADSFKIIENYSENPASEVAIGFQDYLNAEFEDHVNVSENLKANFDEAGKIIQNSLQSISALSVSNINIAGTIVAEGDDTTKTAVFDGEGNVIFNGFSELGISSTPVRIPSAGKPISVENTARLANDGTKLILSFPVNNKEYIFLRPNDSNLLQNFRDRITSGLEGSREINLYGESEVNIYNAEINGNTTNVISMSKDRGIWLGSNKGIHFFSGGITGNKNANQSSAMLSLTPDQIIFGVRSTTDTEATVVDMTKKYLVLAAGTIDGVNHSAIIDSKTDWATSTVSGVKITKDGLWLASSSGTERSLITMTPGDIKIGVTPNSGNTGSFIHLSQSEIIVGANTNIYINAGNIGLDSTAGGAGQPGIGFRLGSGENPRLKFANGELQVTGAIHATSLFIKGSSQEFDPSQIDTGTKTITSDQTPTTNFKEGDLWHNTSNNKMYVANADAGSDEDTDHNYWDEVTSDSGNKTFYQAQTPAQDFKKGDIWYDTTNKKIYVASDDADPNASEADNKVLWKDNGIKTFSQNTPPTSGFSPGDIWYNTKDNAIYIAKVASLPGNANDYWTSLNNNTNNNTTPKKFASSDKPTIFAKNDYWIDTTENKNTLYVAIISSNEYNYWDEIQTITQQEEGSTENVDSNRKAYIMTTEPTTFLKDDIWIDSTNNIMKIATVGKTEENDGSWSVLTKDQDYLWTSSEPTSAGYAYKEGMIWYDSGNNKVYVINKNSLPDYWEELINYRDTQVFNQNTTPALGTFKKGDLWQNGTDLSYATRDGVYWEETGKKTIRQDTTPEVFSQGDIWYNTSNGGTYVAKTNSSDTSIVGDDKWKLINNKVMSTDQTSFIVDADNKLIKMNVGTNNYLKIDENGIEMKGQTLDISANGELRVEGSTVYINAQDSQSQIVFGNPNADTEEDKSKVLSLSGVGISSLLGQFRDLYVGTNRVLTTAWLDKRIYYSNADPPSTLHDILWIRPEREGQTGETLTFNWSASKLMTPRGWTGGGGYGETHEMKTQNQDFSNAYQDGNLYTYNLSFDVDKMPAAGSRTQDPIIEQIYAKVSYDINFSPETYVTCNLVLQHPSEEGSGYVIGTITGTYFILQSDPSYVNSYTNPKTKIKTIWDNNINLLKEKTGSLYVRIFISSSNVYHETGRKLCINSNRNYVLRCNLKTRNNNSVTLCSISYVE